MNLVLAVEPDLAQADRLTSIVRTKLGAQLQHVTSAHAAIVASNHRAPDLVLFGRDLPQDQRTRIVTHIRSLTDGGQVRTLDIPTLASNTSADLEAFSKKIGALLAAAEDARIRAMANSFGRPSESGWGAVTVMFGGESPDADEHSSTESPEDADIRAADVALIEAEVEFRLHGELERLQAETAKQRADELSRVEAEAAERHAREVARVEAEAEQRRQEELARIGREAASQRESAVADARAAAEAVARESLAAELERVRRGAEQQLADEVRRVRGEVDQTLASKLAAAQAEAERDREERIARARAEADAARNAAIEEARCIVAEAAARAKIAEDEVERVRAEADAELKTAVARARAESDAQLETQVARAQAETEARLEAQLAAVISEAEQMRHAHRQAAYEADRIRMEAARAARAAAEQALAEETARIRAEANAQLEAEIARLRMEAGDPEGLTDQLLVPASETTHASRKLLALASRFPYIVRWDYVATAALILLVIIAGVFYLPRAVSTVARTSSSLVGTAGKAAKDAVAAAPAVTRRALDAAERAIPRGAAPTPSPAAAAATLTQADSRPAAADSGPGFVTVFSRIPMDVYADGKRIGTTEDGQLLLNSGTHRLEFVSERFRYRGLQTVIIRPGRVLAHNVVLPTAWVHVTTTPGSEIWIEGKRAGIAPMEPIAVQIGTREIVVKNGAGGEKRQAIEVKYGENLDISLVPESGAVNNNGPSIPRLAPLAR